MTYTIKIKSQNILMRVIFYFNFILSIYYYYYYLVSIYFKFYNFILSIQQNQSSGLSDSLKTKISFSKLSAPSSRVPSEASLDKMFFFGRGAAVNTNNCFR